MKNQEKPKNLLDSASAEDLEKIRQYQASTSGAYPVDDSWLLFTEFLKLAGWEAYLAAKNDYRDEKGNLLITRAEFLTLIEANRKIEAAKHYKAAEASFIGAGSAQAKKPSTAFKTMTKGIIKQTKVEE